MSDACLGLSHDLELMVQWGKVIRLLRPLLKIFALLPPLLKISGSERISWTFGRPQHNEDNADVLDVFWTKLRAFFGSEEVSSEICACQGFLWIARPNECPGHDSGMLWHPMFYHRLVVPLGFSGGFHSKWFGNAWQIFWKNSLPETKIATEHSWSEDDRFPFGVTHFQGRTISFREDTSGQCVFYNYTYKLTKPDCSPHVQFCCALSRWIETSTKKQNHAWWWCIMIEKAQQNIWL